MFLRFGYFRRFEEVVKGLMWLLEGIIFKVWFFILSMWNGNCLEGSYFKI